MQETQETTRTPSLVSKEAQVEDERTADIEKASIEEKKPVDPNVVTWDGPDDPENPMNWSSKKKIAAIAIVSLITLLSPLASTIIAPATEDVLKEFNSTNQTLGAFITSVYLIGYVCGPILIAPLSEIYGRSILYNVCNFLFVIWSMACALSPNLAALIVFRLLAGIASSCPITLGAGSIADMVPIEKRGLAMMGWIVGPLVGPTCGPLIGAYLSQAKGWRWIFWLLTIVSGVIFFICLALLRESFAYTILDRKTKRLQKETGNPNLRSALASKLDSKTFMINSLVRPIKMLFFSPIVFLMSLYMAIAYSYLYLMFTTFPRVFQGIYHFSNGSLGLSYLGIGVGSVFGLFATGLTSDRVLKALSKKNHGVSKPEFRLPIMLIAVWILPVGLFVYGWTADKGVQWIVPIIGTAIVGMGIFPLFMAVSAYLIDAYTVYAASAAAAATILRSLFGALIPLAGSKMYDTLGIGWGTSLLGFIAVAFIPIPYIFWIYGERIRTSKWGKVEF